MLIKGSVSEFPKLFLKLTRMKKGVESMSKIYKGSENISNIKSSGTIKNCKILKNISAALKLDEH